VPETKKILHLTELNNDVVDISRVLKKAGLLFEIEQVTTRKEFVDSLDNYVPDLILSDHHVTEFNSIDALQIFNQHKLVIPFILVTDAVSEEFAASVIKLGADDYILKGNLIRLPHAIKAALKHRLQSVENFNIQLELIKSEEKHRLLVSQASDAIFYLDEEGYFLQVNEKAMQLFEYTEGDFLKMNITELIPAGEITMNSSLVDKLAKGNSVIFERNYKTKTGDLVSVEVNAKKLRDGRFLTIVRDIRERKKIDLLLKGENAVLEMITTEDEIKSILCSIALNYESVSPNTYCSILLVSDNGQQLTHGAAPNLPHGFAAAIDGEMIGPAAGSCGTAAFTKKRVIVSDIANDPLWAGYKDLALKHGLKACWSTPILNIQQKVLGTFAIYYKEICKPANEEIELIDRAANLVKVALEKHCKEIELKTSEEKYRTLVEEASDSILVIDEKGNLISYNKSTIALTGYEATELDGKTIYDFVFEEDLLEAPFHFSDLLTGKTVVSERRMKSKSGQAVFVDIRAKLITENKLLVFVRDITERKNAEEKILKLNNELDHKVKERTAELEAANTDLEEVNNLFVGREARIIELKEELELLKKSP
jgi:PAS domain S-box-containing protein